MKHINVQLDRVQISSSAPTGQKPPLLKGYVIVRDCFVRCQTTTTTYGRCRHYNSLTNNSKIYWQYMRQKGWLKPWKITIVADDKTGLSRDEIERVLRHCRSYQFLTVEIAIDFSPSTGVNKQYIRRHAVFGKSRRRAAKRNRLRYGSRKSDKLVRCYEKVELGAYRVEPEVHSGLLRRNSISVLGDLVRLPELLCPKHFNLVDFDWDRLRRHLANKMRSSSDGVLAGARRRRTSILRLQRYLRRRGVFNTHRFLVQRTMNKDVTRALNQWAQKFNRE
jgi:hypothetical protein